MKRNYFVVVLIFLMFFLISFTSNILGALNPGVVKSFSLNYTSSAVLPFAFFIAFGVMSVPAGILAGKFKEKHFLTAGLIISLFAVVLFLIFPVYYVFVFCLALMGGGMSMLQVTVNPLLKTAGGEENYSFYSVMAQLLSRAASFAGPAVLYYCVTGISTGNRSSIMGYIRNFLPEGMPWLSFYWVLALLFFFLILMVFFPRYPAVYKGSNFKTDGVNVYKNLFHNKTVLFYFTIIFAYIGAEQGVSYWISAFLYKYHNYDPVSAGSSIVGWFWGMMAAGGLTGMGLLKIISIRKILAGSIFSAAVFLALALFGTGSVSLIAFPLVGFSLSVTWSVIFSLAINTIESFNGSFCSVFCLAVSGGAFIQLLIGWIGDALGLRTGMAFIYIVLAYIMTVYFRPGLLMFNEKYKVKNSFFDF